MLNITEHGNRPDFQVDPLIEDYDTKKRRLRYEELVIKKKGDELNWTDADQQELMPLVEEFFTWPHLHGICIKLVAMLVSLGYNE